MAAVQTLPAMLLAAWGVVAAWVLVAALSTRAVSRGERASRWNAALLATTLVAALESCAVPIAPLVRGFGRVAVAPPSEKRAMLDRIIEADRPAMPIALLTLPILVTGLVLAAHNRRVARDARLKARPPVL